MSGTIVLDFTDDPLSGVTLIEQLSHQEWVDTDLQHRHVSFGARVHPKQLVATLVQELLPAHAANVIFNLPVPAPLAVQIVVVGNALLGSAPQCVHLLYPSNALGRDAASPYRLAGMLPVEAAQRIAQQARTYANRHSAGRVVVNFSNTPRNSAGITELHLPLHEHNSVASQMTNHVNQLSIKDWRSALIILPHSNSLAVLVASFLQGLTGTWPNLVVEDTNGDGVIMLESLHQLARSRSNIPLEAELHHAPISWQSKVSANASLASGASTTMRQLISAWPQVRLAP